ncbi:MAG: SDR family oxidoreductase [Gammaproteobacteria bacterium]
MTVRERRIEGRRMLVIGASSGIGRAVAVGAARGGARVVAAARRAERLEQVATETAGAVDWVAADVRSDEDCDRIVHSAVQQLGGLDTLVYAAGMSPLARLANTDGSAWRAILETNVVGAALVCRAAVEALERSGGRAVFLSSVATEDPRPFLVPYSASKAALDCLIRGWRSEHPRIAFTRVVIGPTAGTEFGAHWDGNAMLEFSRIRAERGLARTRPMTVEEVAGEILDAIASQVWVEDLRLMPVNAHPNHEEPRS